MSTVGDEHKETLRDLLKECVLTSQEGNNACFYFAPKHAQAAMEFITFMNEHYAMPTDHFDSFGKDVFPLRKTLPPVEKRLAGTPDKAKTAEASSRNPELPTPRAHETFLKITLPFGRFKSRAVKDIFMLDIAYIAVHPGRDGQVLAWSETAAVNRRLGLIVDRTNRTAGRPTQLT